MQFTILIAFATAASASVVGLSRRQYPDCTASCLQSVDLHGCGISEPDCLCKNEDYVKETTECFVNACHGDEQQQALEVANAVCAAAGVTLVSSEILPSTFFNSQSATATASGSSTTASATSTSSTSEDSNKDGAVNVKLNSLAALAGVGLVAYLL